MELIPFSTMLNRQNTDCSKWDAMPYPNLAADTIPMWVADMDFSCPPAVIDAIQARLQHPVFGYSQLSEQYWDSIIAWQQQRYGACIDKEEIVPVASVLGGVAMAVQALTSTGDAILVPTPGYHAFYNAVLNNNRRLICCPMKDNGKRYEMDFTCLENLLEEEQVKLVLFCSPHNPTGRLWSTKELDTLIEICARYNVPLVSDEIHADMTLGKQFSTIFSANEKASAIAIALYSATKTFNIAGLCTAFAVIKNKTLRERFNQAILASGLKVKNVLGVEALIGGYTAGSQWVDDLQEYILENLRFAVAYFKHHTPRLHVYLPEATYFLWIDFSETGLTAEQIQKKCVYDARVAISCGTEFIEGGDACVRMNCACPREQLEQVLNRFGEIFGIL